jgi:8-oxo-dGTP diphosphatase
MPDRGAMPARRAGYTIDVALLTPLDRHLAVLLVRTPEGALERWALPWGLPKLNDPTLEDAASRVARTALPASPTWLAQVGAFAERRHAADVELSVAFTGTVPVGTLSAPGEMAAWFPVGELPQLAPRQRAMVGSALELVRHRMDFAPIAFRMLPPTFTLSDLQRVYEILLGHRLHKASFRRTLEAASLLEATDEWRSQGRGRPAQLFRLAPKKKRRRRRGVRFDGLP